MKPQRHQANGSKIAHCTVILLFKFYTQIKKSQPKPSSGYYILKLTTKYFQKGGLFQKIYMHFDFFKREQAFYITGWLTVEENTTVI